jgi:Zn-dependent oligopeptidase
MLEREGELRVMPIDSLKETRGEIVKHVETGTNLITDDWAGYYGLQRAFQHYTVNHKAGEYVKQYFAHTNSIEGVWSLLKRQIYGIHHWVSAKHLHRYIAEVTWRYNRREVKDGSRVAEFLGRVDGRLMHKTLIA